MRKFTLIKLKAFWIRCLNFFGIEQSTEGIPEGLYCYSHYTDELGRITKKDEVKVCPHYRNLDDGKTACLYTGFSGHDILHYDMCKICNVKSKTSPIIK
jgi:hypothetical protein